MHITGDLDDDHRLPSLALTTLLHPEPMRIGERCSVGVQSVTIDATTGVFRARADSAGAPLGPAVCRAWHLALSPQLGGARVGGTGPVQVDGHTLGGGLSVSAAQLARGVPVVIDQRLVLWLHSASAGDEPRGPDLGLVGSSVAIERVRRQVRRVAPLELPVLLRGETGSGKEVVARALHAASARPSRPSLALNVGALTPSLAASELFGHVRGAFTGAAEEHAGYLRRAHGGTLFLDEIGEASLEVQALLLRALETQRVQPVGSTNEHDVDVRVVAATDTDLSTAVSEGRFRAALYYRLAGVELTLPPLRERREDVASLWLHFLGGPTVARLPSVPVLLRLLDYDWPGNVRQLRNVVQQLALAEDDEAELALVEALLGATRPAQRPELTRKPAAVSLAEVYEAMRANQWRIERAALALGVSRPSMYRLIAAHPELRMAKDLDRDELMRSYHEAGGQLERMSEQLRVSVPAIRGRIRETLARARERDMRLEGALVGKTG